MIEVSPRPYLCLKVHRYQDHSYGDGDGDVAQSLSMRRR
jgi:hypothetical protein